MARGRTGAHGRRRGQLLAAILLVALVAGGAAWWKSRTWRPDRGDFPVQGVWLSAADAPVEWPLLKVEGVDFAYLTATEGPGVRDAMFTPARDEAVSRHIQTGAVHRYDLCAPADGQAANFVTMVPRDPALLPPAVRLDLDPEHCPNPPPEAAMQSELTTFLNQIERHAGKPALLMLSRAFEARYHLAAVIDRNIWVGGDFLRPGYAGRPWVMWTATDRYRSKAAPRAIRWVVVRP